MSLKYNTRDEIFEEIKKIVIGIHGPYKIELTRDTKIEDDLGCTGDDAYEVMEAFFEKFGVHQGDFDFRRYFWQEGGDSHGLNYLLCKIRGIDYIEQTKYVTLGNLEDSVIASVWKDSEIPSLGLENRSLLKKVLFKSLRVIWVTFYWALHVGIAILLIYKYFFYEN